MIPTRNTRPITVLWPWQTAKLWRLTTSYHILITAGTRIITCVSHVLYVLTKCAVRACPRSKVLCSSKCYSASDAVPIFPHVLPRLKRDCSLSSTRTTSAVSRGTTFRRFLAVIKPSSAVWPGLYTPVLFITRCIVVLNSLVLLISWQNSWTHNDALL